MGRIVAIDYGKKRTGLAWSDPLQIIATGLGAFDTTSIKEKLTQMCQTEEIETFVLGYPTRMDGSDSHVTEEVREFEQWLKTTFPQKVVHLWDERLTSKMAFQAMIDGGLKKKQRRNKGMIDQVSATLILQEFMQ